MLNETYKPSPTTPVVDERKNGEPIHIDVEQLHQVDVVSENVCQAIITRADAFTAVESVFASMAAEKARNFPVVREAIGHADALYGFKSGFDRAGLSLGVKSGGYWPGNIHRGLTNHQSSIFLFDPDTGRLQAIVGGNYLTAVRTAASSAVSIAHLARKDSEVIGMIGAGHQSTYQLEAALDQRAFKKVVAWNKDTSKLARLKAIAESRGLEFASLDKESLCAESDVIITITSSHDALLSRNWVKPGTHIACMGTDTVGKKEIDPNCAISASLFTDEIAQSISIGEFQHAISQRLISEEDITPVGDVINGAHVGRKSEGEITIFDGTGVGLQDLAVASSVLKLAQEQGKEQSIFL